MGTFIVASYVFRFTRLSLVLLVIHYLAEAVFHLCRLLAYTEKTGVSNKLFKLGDLLFVLARLSSVILAVLSGGRVSPPGLDDVELDHVPGEENERVKEHFLLFLFLRLKTRKTEQEKA